MAGHSRSTIPGQYLITGTSGSNGLLYEGPISGVGGISYSVNVPGSIATSVYGPDVLGNGQIRLVGSYRTGNNRSRASSSREPPPTSPTPPTTPPSTTPATQFTYVHSTMGNYAVGNADGPEDNLPLGPGHAFLYNVSQSVTSDIVYPGSTTTTAYGIWDNGDGQYTICGGYSAPGDPGGAISHGYLVDYNALTGTVHPLGLVRLPQRPRRSDRLTHFQGISSDQKGVYTLAADTLQDRLQHRGVRPPWSRVPPQPRWLLRPLLLGQSQLSPGPRHRKRQLRRRRHRGRNSDQPQRHLLLPGLRQPSAFQLSNVISGNRGNGIGLYGASDNVIAMNNIGTDVTGTRALGNAQNGILLTQGASRNLIGGQATNGNDPTAGVFARPPQGNLISGNHGNGVLMNRGATQNLLSGNFVGTTAMGSTPLGNRLDGVSIDHANANQLIGCTFQQNPFVFYNVISGNGGNGLHINSSNNTVVQANFFGAGANNATVVGNHGDGVLVSGTSQNTQIGGVIPLGNVISGNNRNGTEIRDRAAGTVNFNTFAGLFAFGTAAPNRQNGFLVTSTGGNNQIRTCIVSGNLGNGIVIAGNATGVQVEQTAVGTNTNIQEPLPNMGSGIVITGHAHNNAIGGYARSIEPQTTVSANNRYGIQVTGAAHDNTIFNTYVGSSAGDRKPLGNRLDGIYLGHGTSGTTIGGTGNAQDRIVDNYGHGIVVQGSRNNLILSSEIATNALGGLDISGNVSGSKVQNNNIHNNSGNGVSLACTRNLLIGGPLANGNRILSNKGFGVIATGNSLGTVVQRNTIAANSSGNVNFTNSRGVVYIP